MTLHQFHFALWNIGIKVCDRLPGQGRMMWCWIHGGILGGSAFSDLPDADWERWGWHPPVCPDCGEDHNIHPLIPVKETHD